MLFTPLALTLKKSGLGFIIDELVQSNSKIFLVICWGILLIPTSAPIKPPTMQALVSVSPPN